MTNKTNHTLTVRDHEFEIAAESEEKAHELAAAVAAEWMTDTYTLDGAEHRFEYVTPKPEQDEAPKPCPGCDDFCGQCDNEALDEGVA